MDKLDELRRLAQQAASAKWKINIEPAVILRLLDCVAAADDCMDEILSADHWSPREDAIIHSLREARARLDAAFKGE